MLNVFVCVCVHVCMHVGLGVSASPFAESHPLAGVEGGAYTHLIPIGM